MSDLHLKFLYTVLLASYFMWSGALDISGVLQSYSAIPLSYHITNILILPFFTHTLLSQAKQCYETAIKIKPSFADAFANLGALLKDVGHLGAALDSYTKALEIVPTHAEAHANLVHSKMAVCDWGDRASQFEVLREQLAKQLMIKDSGAVPSVQVSLSLRLKGVFLYIVGILCNVECCIGKPLSSYLLLPHPAVALASHISIILISTLQSPSLQPFHALSYPLSMAELLQISQKYALRCKSSVSLVETHFTFRPKPKSVRLRIGYVSSDFGNHPMSHLTQSVFGMHDSSKFEVCESCRGYVVV